MTRDRAVLQKAYRPPPPSIAVYSSSTDSRWVRAISKPGSDSLLMTPIESVTSS